MTAGTSIDTKTQILDAAERLIAEKGFSGTTLRNIVSAAGVNLAAVSYHFGSKEDLLRAVVHRIAVPVVTGQRDRLEQLKQKTDTPSVEDLLITFLTPPLEFVMGNESYRLVRAQFMGRCRSEPEPVQSIAHGEFSPNVDLFLDALQRALPDQSRSQLTWKLDLVVAALIRVQTEASKPGALLRSSQPQDIQETIASLVKFLAAGMQA
ncbi:MAG: TetR/AcrR family transcriptional regulator [Leptolyngbya sp. SIOISBB]|nr:TetR/AcrR family transcriptional regulator [Leptolyngbya sp. SIOISBB]